jgi:hypothetical protein
LGKKNQNHIASADKLKAENRKNRRTTEKIKDAHDKQAENITTADQEYTIDAMNENTDIHSAATSEYPRAEPTKALISTAGKSISVQGEQMTWKTGSIENSINQKQFANIDPAPATPAETKDMSGMALAGFICGVLGLILVLITGWPFLLGTLGTVFSAIGLNETSKGKKGRGFAIAGLITGIMAIVIFWLYVAILSLYLL